MADTPINVLLVDDEKKACANLKNLLKTYADPSINILGMANSTAEAEELVSKHKPDAVFLDIEMPNENAFQFLERISPVRFEVIFVTAYDEYAVRAFKLNAVDYILKPISINELVSAVDKLKEKLKVKDLLAGRRPSYTEVAAQIKNKAKQNKITLKDGNMIEVVDFNDIYFIEALSSYSRILFMKGGEVKEITMSSPLSDYEELLPPELFYRIHRSYLINCRHIKTILKDDTNQVVFKNNMSLPVSRRRLPLLLAFLKSNEHYND